jgi:hypothetical protein
VSYRDWGMRHAGDLPQVSALAPALGRHMASRDNRDSRGRLKSPPRCVALQTSGSGTEDPSQRKVVPKGC